MTTADLHGYRAVNRKPTSVGYRGYDVYGMAPSSSGGSTVGEALNIMERYDLGGDDRADALHHYLEASALAFADRGAYVGDPSVRGRPAGRPPRRHLRRRARLQDQRDHRARQAGRGGQPRGVRRQLRDRRPRAAARDDADTENISTTNLTVADRWGNVVEYTLTIEQTGGSGIVVPGRGFILNNELTDFSTVYSATRPQPHPARQAAALVDVADDRAQGRRALARARLARRLDDHHHGAADAVQPHRPRDDASSRPSPPRAPRSATRPRSPPSSRSSTPTARC